MSCSSWSGCRSCYFSTVAVQMKVVPFDLYLLSPTLPAPVHLNAGFPLPLEQHPRDLSNPWVFAWAGPWESLLPQSPHVSQDVLRQGGLSWKWSGFSSRTPLPLLLHGPDNYVSLSPPSNSSLALDSPVTIPGSLGIPSPWCHLWSKPTPTASQYYPSYFVMSFLTWLTSVLSLLSGLWFSFNIFLCFVLLLSPSRRLGLHLSHSPRNTRALYCMRQSGPSTVSNERMDVKFQLLEMVCYSACDLECLPEHILVYNW